MVSRSISRWGTWTLGVRFRFWGVCGLGFRAGQITLLQIDMKAHVGPYTGATCLTRAPLHLQALLEELRVRSLRV